ncbi:hypothetical protein [Nostoc sp. MG11]|uniref:hypothetical protein n=1 Tax=Nostoc sp. MG11 TaxID=2721166 RepID=UPI00186725C0|nr:hypothetical protein [Nostoc sp. MG11]
MIHKSELFCDLPDEKIQAILKACYLQDKSDYTDDERHLFNECRALIEQSKSSEELAQHFAYRKDLVNEIAPLDESIPPQKSNNKSKKASKSKPVSLFELKAIISDLIGSKVSLADTLKVIEASKLEEKEEYTQQECDLIIETISDEDESIDFNATIQGLSTASSEGFAKLVDRVTDKLAETAPDAFNQIYMQKITANMERNQQQIRDFYHQLEETIIAELEGKKSPLQILIERRSRTNLSSLCSMKSAASLPESNSDSTTS